MKVLSGSIGLIVIGRAKERDETITLAPHEERTFEGYCSFSLLKGTVEMKSAVPELSLCILRNGYVSTPYFSVKAGETDCVFKLTTSEIERKE